MISFKSAAKTTAEHGKARPKKHRPCFLKPENYSIQTKPSKILYRSQVNIWNLSHPIDKYFYKNLLKMSYFQCGKIPQMKKLYFAFILLIVYSCGVSREQASTSKKSNPMN
jgi:hypothetical protein